MTKQGHSQILLVEDNALDRELAIRSFKASGFEGSILSAGDGLEALKILSSSMIHNLKLALVDLKLPDLDGFEVVRAIRSSEKTKDLPVIVLSSTDDQGDIRASFAAGANKFFTKPMSYQDMEKIAAGLSPYWRD